MFLLHEGQSPVRTFHHVSELFSIVLGIFFNVTLMFIIRKHRKGPLKSYGRVVMMNCIMDFVLTMSTLISEIQTDTQGGAMFLVSNGYLGTILPPIFRYPFAFIWSFGMGFSILYQPVPFYHRYYTICSNKEPTQKQMTVVFSIPILACVWNVCAMGVALCMVPNPREYAYLINYPTWTQQDGKVPMYVMIHMKNWSSWVFTTSCAITFPLATITAVFFYWKIYQTLRINRKFMTARTMRMQMQLNRALLSQLIFPLIFGIAPVTVFMCIMLLQAKIHNLPVILSALLSWIPVINPILILGLVNAYRRDFLYPIRCLFCYTIGKKELNTEVSSNTKLFASKTVGKTRVSVLSKVESIVDSSKY